MSARERIRHAGLALAGTLVAAMTGGCSFVLDWDFAVGPAPGGGDAGREDGGPPRDGGDPAADTGPTDAGPVVHSDLVEIAAGGAHTCARRSDGAIFCWGDNRFAQLGRGTTSMTEHAPAIAVAPIATMQLALGGFFTCARSGDVRCWGADESGQLGDGTPETAMAMPSPMMRSTDVCEITAGTAFTCMRRGTGCGVIECSGENDHGQLGRDPTLGGSAVPTLVLGTEDVTAVDAGDDHACVVTAARTVRCWGRNDSGQLGDGSRIDSSVPVGAGLSDQLQVAAGGSFSCALAASGELSCWGAGARGELATGMPTSSPVPVTGGHRFDLGPRTLDLGQMHGCGVSGEEVRCWGDDSYEQLGQTSDIPLSSPTRVTGIGGTPVQVATGASHSCVLTAEGDVWCWGDNSRGQLGVPYDAAMPRREAPARVEIPPP